MTLWDRLETAMEAAMGPKPEPIQVDVNAPAAGPPPVDPMDVAWPDGAFKVFPDPAPGVPVTLEGREVGRYVDGVATITDPEAIKWLGHHVTPGLSIAPPRRPV